MSKVSIIIPIVRVDRVDECLKSIKANSGIPKTDYEILTDFDVNRIGCPKMVARLLVRSRYDLVMFLGDDTVGEADFILNALAAMARLPDGWGLVGLNDQFHDGNKLATHWLADKRLLPLIDFEFFHTGYKHLCCDMELMSRVKGLGRYIWAKDARLTHNHPLVNGTADDDDYRRIYSPQVRHHDQTLYSRRKHLWENT